MNVRDIRPQKKLKEATLIYVLDGESVELAKKYPGKDKHKPGEGCWNGAGGGREYGESWEECALRELWEEFGFYVLPEYLTYAGILYLHNTPDTDEPFTITARVYTVPRSCVMKLYWWRVLTSWFTREKLTNGRPKRFSVDALPQKEMMPADPHFLPHLIAGEKIIATVWYGPRQQSMTRDPQIVVVDSLPD